MEGQWKNRNFLAQNFLSKNTKGGQSLIKVCDAIMGSGKSQSAISYMNDNPDKRFVYITPYLQEAERIRDGCPALHFTEPNNKLPQHRFSKLEHTRHLLKEGCNITTTHAAFRSYTQDMVDSIRKYGYVLIIDEAVDTFQETKCSASDLKVLFDGGYIVSEEGRIKWSGKEYESGKLGDLVGMLRCNNLVQLRGDGARGRFYYWALSDEVLRAFQEVYVLTYLFEGADLRYYLDICGLEYEYIGIHYDGVRYTFTDKPDYIPGYVKTLGDRIHICEHEKLNRVGEHKYAISENWLSTHPEQTRQLKNNIYNYVRNYQSGGNDAVMWCTFKRHVSALKGRGYAKGWTPFNLKATNEYRYKTGLVYAANIFASPVKKEFFRQFGVEYDEDGYALSVMVQWIWRSAIRDGKDVEIYIPSSRMRSLLKEWIATTSKGGKSCTETERATTCSTSRTLRRSTQSTSTTSQTTRRCNASLVRPKQST